MPVKSTTPSTEPKEFPKLMKSIKWGNVWLMETPNVGTLVKGGPNTGRIVGYHSRELYASTMRDYNQPVTLENV